MKWLPLFSLLFLGPSVPSAPTFMQSTTVIPSFPSPATFAWNANPSNENVMGYKLTVDATVHDVGNVLTFLAALGPGAHQATLAAYNLQGLGPASQAYQFSIAGSGGNDPCTVGGVTTIVVSNYTNQLTPGEEGQVVAKVIGPSPVTQIQILLGTQVVGEIPVGGQPGVGLDLRFVRAIGFGSPRVPGSYNLTLAARDARGCRVTTSIARPLVIG